MIQVQITIDIDTSGTDDLTDEVQAITQHLVTTAEYVSMAVSTPHTMVRSSIDWNAPSQ